MLSLDSNSTQKVLISNPFLCRRDFSAGCGVGALQVRSVGETCVGLMSDVWPLTVVPTRIRKFTCAKEKVFSSGVFAALAVFSPGLEGIATEVVI